MLKPVKYYQKVKYPDKAQILLDPGLLREIPARWKGNRYISTALASLLIMGMTSCAGKATGNSPGGTGKSVGQTTAPRSPAVVSPVFIHGEGRGSFGCMSIAPPAFLSEEEALQVIQEEAQKAGLDFKKDGYTLKNVGIPKTELFYDYTDEKAKSGKLELMDIKTGDLELDGIDRDKKIGFEFISRDDVVKWHKLGGMISTVEDYRMLAAAETLKKGLEGKTGDISVGVLYDPVAWIGEKGFTEKADAVLKDKNLEIQDEEASLKDISEEQLREQVRDFLEWLKGEGII